MSKFSDPLVVVEKWFEAIMKRDYVRAWQYTQTTYKNNHRKAQLKIFDNVAINSFKIISSEKITEAHLKVIVEADQNGKVNHAEVHVICENGPYKPTPKGHWGVNPISALKNVTLAELQQH